MNNNWCEKCDWAFESEFRYMAHVVNEHLSSVRVSAGPTQDEIDGAIASILAVGA